MTHFRKYAICVFLALSLLLQACAPLKGVQPTPEPVKLKVLLLPFLSFAPFFIAEEEGYFAEQGLQIEFVKMDKAAQATPALAQGELDVVGGGISFSTLNAIARGARIKVVADKGHAAATACAFNALVARRELVGNGELDSPAQLQGRRVVIDPANFEGYYVEKLLNTAGLTLDDVEIVTIPDTVLPEAFEKGTIDLAGTAEPWVTRILRAEHAVLWMPLRQMIPNFQFSFIVYGPTLLDENPDVGKRFMVAYLKAVQQYNKGKTERNLEILAEHTGLDRELLMQACWPALHDDGRINVQSVLDFQAWALEKGYLDSLLTEEQFWDPSFVEYANEVVGAPSR